MANNLISLDEAFQLTLDKILELKNAGIPVDIQPSKSSNDTELIAEYSGKEYINHTKWCHVTFYPKSDEHHIAIERAINTLNQFGIHFDTGGSETQRDWELDWSFRYNGEYDKN